MAQQTLNSIRKTAITTDPRPEIGESDQGSTLIGPTGELEGRFTPGKPAMNEPTDRHAQHTENDELEDDPMSLYPVSEAQTEAESKGGPNG